jgi:hypothetical protein
VDALENVTGAPGQMVVGDAVNDAAGLLATFTVVVVEYVQPVPVV